MDSAPTTIPSIYNVIAMEARPKKTGNSLDKNKIQFGNFMNLLKELRESNKISAEELREYRKNWENYPKNRKIITDTLTAKRT